MSLLKSITEALEESGLPTHNVKQHTTPLFTDPWIVKRLGLKPGRIHAFAGEAGSVKTTAAVNLAVALAANRKVYGEYEGPGRPLKVLHADFDQGSDLNEVYHDFMNGMHIDPDSLKDHLLYQHSPPRIDHEGQEEFLKWFEVMCAHFDFIIIDSLRGLLGNLDESDPRVANQLEPLKDISLKYGCTVLVLAHAGKAGVGKAGAQAVRGSSGFTGVWGALFTFQRCETKDGSASWVEVRQQRRTMPGQRKSTRPFSLWLEDVKSNDPKQQATHDALYCNWPTEVRPPWGSVLTHSYNLGGVSEEERAAEAQADKAEKLKEWREAVTNYVAANPSCSFSRVRDNVRGVGKDDYRDAINAMVSEGLLVCSNERYTVPPPRPVEGLEAELFQELRAS